MLRSKDEALLDKMKWVYDDKDNKLIVCDQNRELEIRSLDSIILIMNSTYFFPLSILTNSIHTTL